MGTQTLLGLTGFTHSVASGEPGPDSALLWTRFVPTAGGPAKVRVEVADSRDFAKIVGGGQMITGPWRDHTVKITVDGLQPGRFYWYRFIGPDGVGKSTWLGLIAGARKIQQGTVEVLGGDMASQRHREAVCPRIAYMPQGLGKNLYPTLSVFENIDFFGRLFGHHEVERMHRIADLLDELGEERAGVELFEARLHGPDSQA